MTQRQKLQQLSSVVSVFEIISVSVLVSVIINTPISVSVSVFQSYFSFSFRCFQFQFLLSVINSLLIKQSPVIRNHSSYQSLLVTDGLLQQCTVHLQEYTLH